MYLYISIIYSLRGSCFTAVSSVHRLVEKPSISWEANIIRANERLISNFLTSKLVFLLRGKKRNAFIKVAYSAEKGHLAETIDITWIMGFYTFVSLFIYTMELHFRNLEVEYFVS